MGSQPTPPGSKSARPSLIQSSSQASQQAPASNQVLSSLANTSNADLVARPLMLWKTLLIGLLILGLLVLGSILLYLHERQGENSPELAFSGDATPANVQSEKRLRNTQSAETKPDATAHLDQAGNATANIVEDPTAQNALSMPPKEDKPSPQVGTPIPHPDKHDPMLDITKEELVSESQDKREPINKQALALPMLSMEKPEQPNAKAAKSDAAKPDAGKDVPKHAPVSTAKVNAVTPEKPAANPNVVIKPTAKSTVKANTDRDVDLVSALVSNDIVPADGADTKAADKSAAKPNSVKISRVTKPSQDTADAELALCKEKSFFERELCYVQICTKLGGKHPDCASEPLPSAIPGVSN